MELILLNTTEGWQSGWIRYYGDEGERLAVKPMGAASATAFRYSIAPGGLHVMQTDGSPVGVAAGWAEVVPDSGTTTPAGAGIFSRSSQGCLITESGVPSAGATTRARIYVDMSNGHDSGLAIAAIDGAPLRLEMKARRSDGTELAEGGSGTLDLPGNGHRAAFASQWVAGLGAGFRGVLAISAPAQFAAVTLRSLVNALSSARRL
jgi:hypothetical protein